MEILAKREFTNGYVASVDINGRPAEITATCLPFSTEMRGTGNTDNLATDWNSGQDFWKEKMMVGVSTASGCAMMCKFCAVNALTKKCGTKTFHFSEITEQVQKAISMSGHAPSEAKLFRILFTRMGEPALNVNHVRMAMCILKEKYPNARIQISTVAPGGQATYELLEAIDDAEKRIGSQENWVELQFSCHSTADWYRRWLINDRVLPLSEISLIGDIYYNKRPRDWKITLNFALSEKAPFDVGVLKNTFNPDHFFIKLSDINDNVSARKNGIKSLITAENEI